MSETQSPRSVSGEPSRPHQSTFRTDAIRVFTLSRTTERSLHRMARKPNYDFEKRRKEQDRKARKDAKRADRQQRREERQAEDAETTSPPAADEGQPGPGPGAI